MSAPFTKFKVRRSYITFTGFVIKADFDYLSLDFTTASEGAKKDWETDARRFIESAIREKIEREKD